LGEDLDGFSEEREVGGKGIAEFEGGFLTRG
jgi:hypothetical protein